MAVDRLPGGEREFASYLDGLLARLEPGGGWSGVFWQRDPDGMRACLDGSEVPPWDVVEALLADLAAGYGPAAAAAERERARALHRAALTAYDARPGARDTLADRLDVMLREQRYAVERQAALTRLLSAPASADEADSLRLDLAWARDDHARATARCAELRGRLAELARREAGPPAVPPKTPPRRPLDGAQRDGAGRFEGVARDAAGPLGGVERDVAGPVRDAARRPSESAPASARTEPPVRCEAGSESWAAGPASDAAGRAAASAFDEGFRSAASMAGPPAAAQRSPFADAAAGGRSSYPVASGAGEESDVFGLTAGPPAAVQRSPFADAAAGGRSSYPVVSGAGEDSGPVGYAAGAPAPARPFPLTDAAAPALSAQVPTDAAAPGLSAQVPTDAPDIGPSAQRAVQAPSADGLAPPVVGPGEAGPRAGGSSASAKPRRRRRGGARFAGMAEDGDLVQQVPSVMPEAPARGARFAGGAEAVEAEPDGGGTVDAAAGAAVAGVVERLARLRAEGRSGEAHVLLTEAAQWPAGRFPPLADALDRAGLGADWVTLLWEAASLPAERLVAVSDALTAVGRDADGRQLLRQGVARPPEQIGAAVLRLEEEGRQREAGALLDACVRVRTAEEAARSAAPVPHRLVPLLLRAARAVSDERYWDLVHALRVAGHTT
ncbi:hypothetical protein GCM10010260_18630 [Streptomyces filipinensis]|uniref:UL36 very large tegument protein n=1 Tax=Streptomyces filipinensis TaxID=66887 RepID=A0A918I8V9_9ACTN|nr:hypothetical protein [Streptomyces filipinensis]GGU86023.1 hypothetical protein GCM10010260_18630 [Streptomyces filipinensis]